jgi:hypothetical protein
MSMRLMSSIQGKELLILLDSGTYFFNLLAHILPVLDMLLVLTFQWNASFNSIFLYDFKVESLAI